MTYLDVLKEVVKKLESIDPFEAICDWEEPEDIARAVHRQCIRVCAIMGKRNQKGESIMNDKEMYKVLTEFGNAHTLARDFNVNAGPGGRTFTARDSEKGAKIEDVEVLAQIMNGAYHFLMWARRKKIVRFKKVGK